jgi:hypothetical protein
MALDRRRFLSGLAAGAAGSAVPAHVRLGGSVMNSTEEIDSALRAVRELAA